VVIVTSLTLHNSEVSSTVLFISSQNLYFCSNGYSIPGKRMFPFFGLRTNLIVLIRRGVWDPKTSF
jgi:hypothetical protein